MTTPPSAPTRSPLPTRVRRTPPDGARRARPIYRVFVSSTWLDLRLERQALMDALHRMEEMRFVGMEFFGNRPDDTHAASIDQVEACEVFVGVIGFRYGSGITEAEYRRARELGLPCFIYLKDEAVRQPELTDGDPALEARLAAFKTEILREHTVKTFAHPADLAANATADLHNWVAAQWVSLDDAPLRTRATKTDTERTNLLRLLERIQHDWIEGVLEASLHHRAWIDLGLDWKEGAVEHPWDRIVVAPNRPIQALGAKDTIAEVFTAAQNTLLVLGEPGAGKTTSLLELARDLIALARNSATEPAPVVLALSTWTGAQPDFAAWLVHELGLRYQVPKRLARTWVEEGRLVLLLDGLDEVLPERRERCVAAINAFQQAHPPPGLAVTCRVAEYDALQTKLVLRAAVCLQPLSSAQVERYLASAGSRLAALADALRQDQNLQELARTPLMLSVMTMAWRDGADAELAAAGAASDRRSQIFEAYVCAMIGRRGKAAGVYSPEETRHWLAWLAQRMKQHGQTLFTLEQLQPTWLREGWSRPIYFFLTRLSWTVALAAMWVVLAAPAYVISREGKGASVLMTTGGVILVVGIILGVGVAAIDATMARIGARLAQPGYARFLAMLAVMAAVIALSNFLLPHLGGKKFAAMRGAVSLFAVIFGGAFCGPLDVAVRDISPTDTMRWSWRLAFDRFSAMGISLCVVVVMFTVALLGIHIANRGWSAGAEVVGKSWSTVVGAAAGAAVAMGLWLKYRPPWRGTLVPTGLAIVTIVALVGAFFGPSRGGALRVLASGVIWSGLIALLGGFAIGTLDPARPRRLGAWFWLRVPLLALLAVGGLVTALFTAFLVLLANSLTPADRVDGIAILTSIGGIFALVAFLRFGGMSGWQHYLLRRMLRREGSLPRGAEAFFNHAAQLAILQKVGFGYRFVHALLLEHLATTKSTPPVRR